MLRFIRKRLFVNFRLVLAIQQFIQKRFTPLGLLLFTLLGMTLLVSFDMQRTLAYQTLCLGSVLILFSWIFSRKPPPVIKIRREYPDIATCGQAFRYKIIVENPKKYRLRGLSFKEIGSEVPPSFEDFLKTRDPNDAERNFFDRWVGFPRFYQIFQRSKRFLSEDQYIGTLPAQKHIEVEVELMPLRRGVCLLQGFEVSKTDPFGLFRSFKKIKAPEKLLILPKLYPVAQPTLPGRQIYQKGGQQMALSIGESEEFISLRDYRSGDPKKKIHWKTSARMNQLVVKEYQDEYLVRHALILDTCREESSEFVFEEAVNLASSYVCNIPSFETLLDLLFVGDQSYHLTAGRGVSQVRPLLEVLAEVQMSGKESFGLLGHELQKRIGTLSGAIVILLNWDETRREILEPLEKASIPYIAYVVNDESESKVLRHTEVGHVFQVRYRHLKEDLL